MATVKIVVLKHQKKEDGTYNVKVRLTHNRQSTYIPTNVFITKKQLNDKYQIYDEEVLINLDTNLLKYRKQLMKIDNIDLYNAKQLAEKLISESNPKTERLDFLEFMETVIQDLKLKGRYSYTTYQSSYNHLSKFSGGTLFFTDITSSLLKSFERYLVKRGVGLSGVFKYMSCTRATFNLGREEYNDEDFGDIKIPNNPFSKYKIPSEPEPRTISAGIDVVLLMYNYAPKNNLEEFARDSFLLSFYLIGMNTVDLYSCKSRIENNRIKYKRSKTKDKRTDGAEISIKVELEVLDLVNKYKDKSEERTFIFYKLCGSCKYMNNKLSNGFKSIRDNLKEEIDNKDFNKLNLNTLTMYSARHSWATIASHNCNIIDSHIARCLNHRAERGLAVTNKYIKRDWSIIDNSNRKVLDFVNEQIKKDIEQNL